MREDLRQLSRRDSLLAWYGALGSGLLWAAHVVAVYAWDEAACSNDEGVEATEAVILAMTGVALVGILASGAAALVTWRWTRSGRMADPRGRIALLAAFGMLGAVLFTFATILEGIQVIVLPPCAPG